MTFFSVIFIMKCCWNCRKVSMKCCQVNWRPIRLVISWIKHTESLTIGHLLIDLSDPDGFLSIMTYQTFIINSFSLFQRICLTKIWLF